MANLVSPGYKKSALINRVLSPSEERVIEFKGLNRNPVFDEGEMSDMVNMSADSYPVLAPRRLRGEYVLPDGVIRPLEIESRYNRLAMIAVDENNNVNFYYDDQKIPKVNNLTDSTKMVCINTKICFFPQKTYLELIKEGSSVSIGEYGHLEASFDNSAPGSTAINIAANTDEAILTFPSQHSFGYDDAITIDGNIIYGSPSASMPISVSSNVLNTTLTTLSIPSESFIEILGEGANTATFTGSISRTMPTLDLVIEWNNRLWGANSEDNTIYACKLGDPKNWQYFQGTSLDSYYAQQGTDGDWTGVGSYSGHLCFFKESSMCKIYGTCPANYQITNAQCYGVEAGSRRSVVTINDTIFYKSQIGIMAYGGSVPYCISEKFNCRFRNVVGATEGTKYYASIQKEGEGYELMVLNIDRGTWHKEDRTRFRGSCTVNNRLHYISHDDEQLLCDDNLYCDNYLIIGSDDFRGSIGLVNPKTPNESYDTMPWSAIFGPFDEFIESKKIYSKLSLRMTVFTGSTVSIYISIDEGVWELVKSFNPVETSGEIVPIIPRRCDRYAIKIEGMGKCEIKALTRRVRSGTYGKI